LYHKIDPKIAPALQHQAEELKRAKLETALAHKIENRPPASELIDHNILHGKEMKTREGKGRGDQVARYLL
jgi:hypothetical protein